MKNISKCFWVMLMVSMGHSQTCYNGTKTRGTPEELTSTYFVRESTHQHVHPMANAELDFIAQVSNKFTGILAFWVI